MGVRLNPGLLQAVRLRTCLLDKGFKGYYYKQMFGDMIKCLSQYIKPHATRPIRRGVSGLRRWAAFLDVHQDMCGAKLWESTTRFPVDL